MFAQVDAPPRFVSYDYAYIQVMPRREKGEVLNVGVILFCRTRRFLAARIHLNRPLLQQLDPQIDLEMVEAHLALIPRICQGEGPIGALGQAETFHWLVAPHSTVVQCSTVHCGLCADPQVLLEALMTQIR